MTTTTTNKDIMLRVRVTKEFRERFSNVCKKKAINSSELIRQLIERWLMEQQDSNNPHNRGTDI